MGIEIWKREINKCTQRRENLATSQMEIKFIKFNNGILQALTAAIPKGSRIQKESSPKNT